MPYTARHPGAPPPHVLLEASNKPLRTLQSHRNPFEAIRTTGRRTAFPNLPTYRRPMKLLRLHLVRPKVLRTFPTSSSQRMVRSMRRLPEYINIKIMHTKLGNNILASLSNVRALRGITMQDRADRCRNTSYRPR